MKYKIYVIDVHIVIMHGGCHE